MNSPALGTRPHLSEQPRSKPRVCLLTETYYPVVGGGETQARLLTMDLAARGVRVTLVTRRSDARLQQVEQSDNVTLHRVGPAGSEHFKKWGLLLTAAAALVRLRHEYDIVLVSGFRILGIPAILLGKLFRKRCLLKADSNGEMSGEFFHAGLQRLGLSSSSVALRAFLWIRNGLLRKADGYVAISTDIAAELQASGVDRGSIYSIPNGVDTSKFHPVSRAEKLRLRARLGLPQNRTIVTYAGRLVSYKGLPMLLEVWRQIAHTRSDAALLLVGSGGLDIHNCEPELKDYVQSNGLHGVVHFTGDVENVQEYLQASDAFASPTHRESFGLALLEAMACGLAAVTTPVGGARDFITHRSNGILVQPGSFSELYEALNMLVEDLPMRHRLGRAAAQTARRAYSREAIGEQYEALFDLLAADAARRPEAYAPAP